MANGHGLDEGAALADGCSDRSVSSGVGAARLGTSLTITSPPALALGGHVIIIGLYGVLTSKVTPGATPSGTVTFICSYAASSTPAVRRRYSRRSASRCLLARMVGR